VTAVRTNARDGCGRFAAAAAIVVVALLGGASPAAARGAVSPNFVGMNADPRLTGLRDVGYEFRLMRRAGVGAVRLPIQWDAVEPTPGARQLAGVDRFVGAAAAAGLRIMAVVGGAPPWARQFPDRHGSPPASPASFATVMGMLVRRYGPNGAFWRAHPRLPPHPVHIWQLWNEPNVALFWDGGASSFDEDPAWPRAYAALARAAIPAVRAVDPRARIVLAGLANTSWEGLRALLTADRSLGHLVNAVAIHPYTARPDGVVTVVRMARQVLDEFGYYDLPIAVSEWGWTSDGGSVSPFGFSQAGQAARAARGLRLLVAARRSLRLSSTFWFTWATPDDGDGSYNGAATFSYSGLRRLAGRRRTIAKPAFRAFATTARALERPRG
jgi:hypothetical protein